MLSCYTRWILTIASIAACSGGVWPCQTTQNPVHASSCIYTRRKTGRHGRDQSMRCRGPALRPGATGWTFMLLIAFWLQSRHQFGIDWLAAGRIDVAAIEAGEWWRAITALTLHADVAHLFVNIGFGAVFGSLLARQIGVGMAWLMILIGGTGGNLMNALVQKSWHTAIGASTAVFAALGLLGAYLWTGRRLIHDSWARRWTPVVGAIVLLAWLGTGDERTDIVAHLTGFLVGFAIGALLGRITQPGAPDMRRQGALGALAVFCVILAWLFAVF